jgi:hypothetical protein
MKHRLRKLALSFAVICALAAVPAAMAQAHEYKVAGANLGAGNTKNVTSSGGPFELSTKIGSTSVVIKCTTQSSSGATIAGGGGGGGTITFSTCSIPAAPACVVPNISSAVSTELIGTTELFTKFKPSTGTLFANVFVEECALEGSFEVKGNTAGFDSAAGTEQASHTLSFSSTISTKAGTALTFGGNAATLTGSSTLTLSPSQNWSAS